jgi:hypothetical protein
MTTRDGCSGALRQSAVRPKPLTPEPRKRPPSAAEATPTPRTTAGFGEKLPVQPVLGHAVPPPPEDPTTTDVTPNPMSATPRMVSRIGTALEDVQPGAVPAWTCSEEEVPW